VVAQVNQEILDRREGHGAKDQPLAVTRRAGLPRHRDEGVRVPRLDGAEIADVVPDPVELAGERDAFEGVRDHPVILRVHIAVVDLYTAAPQLRVFLVSKRGPDLAEDRDRAPAGRGELASRAGGG